jgi:hypothetical protein
MMTVVNKMRRLSQNGQSQLTVYVLDRTGKPVPGAWVYVTQVYAGSLKFSEQKQTLLDGKAGFSLPWEKPISGYDVEVWPPQGYDRRKQASYIRTAEENDPVINRVFTVSLVDDPSTPPESHANRYIVGGLVGAGTVGLIWYLSKGKGPR